MESMAIGVRRDHPASGVGVRPEGTRRTASRFRDALLVLAALSVASPYLLPTQGIRGEQLVVYPSLLIVLFTARLSRQEWSQAARVPLIWIATLIPALLATTVSTLDAKYRLSWQATLATTDAIMLSAACLLLVMVVMLQSDDRRATLLRISLALIVVTAVNGLVAAASSVTDLSGTLSTFWSGGSADSSSVAARALRGSRYSGFFNQPYEAGLAHSVGLLLVAYLFVGRRMRLSVLGPLAASIVVGGLLPASKVFLLGGMPLAMLYLIVASGQRHRFRNGFAAFSVTALLGAWAVSALPSVIGPWKRLDGILTEDVLAGVSGGRYTAGPGSLAPVLQQAMESPIVGHGLDPQIGPLDNALLAQLVLSGLVGLVLFGWMSFSIGRGAPSGLRVGASNEATLHLALVLLLVGAMAGAHPFLVNRAGSLLALSLGALLAFRQPAMATRRVVSATPSATR